MTFENRKRLAEHYLKLGKEKKDKKLQNHPYVIEMKKNKGDNPKTVEIEEPTPEIAAEIAEEEAKNK